MNRLLPLILSCFMIFSACAPVGRIDVEDSSEQSQENTPQDENKNTPEEKDPEPQEPQLSPQEQKARDILASMTTEQKVGQMFLVRCPETNAASEVTSYAPGGYLLFGRDFKEKTKEQAVADIASYQAASSVPMLIAVDEEGGTVTRISRYKQFRSIAFHSPRELYKEGGFDLIQVDTADKCRLLSSLGINVNMAPVCDVTLNPDSFMYKRAFGDSAEMTVRYVRNVSSVMRDEKMGSVLKHFPGYGETGDSHTAVTYDERPLDSFYSSDFLPFKEGVASGSGAVLICHNIVKSMDETAPASLSPKVHEIFRAELGNSVVAMTDDLYMDAVRNSYETGEAAVLAVLAGNDMLCCTEYNVQIPAVIAAVQSGRIPMESVDQSVMRILLWKINLGIIK